MNRLLLVLSLSVVVLLEGCTTLVFVPKENLRAPAVSTPLQLEQQFSTEVNIGPLSNITRLGLHQGTYAPIFADENGTFYKGQAWCVRVHIKGEATPKWVRNGGFWLPNNSSKFRPKIFAYREEMKDWSPSMDASAESKPDTEAAAQSAIVANALSISSPTPLQAGAGTAVAFGVLALIDTKITSDTPIFFWADIPVNAGLERELRR